jgi:hypothetical protein
MRTANGESDNVADNGRNVEGEGEARRGGSVKRRVREARKKRGERKIYPVAFSPATKRTNTTAAFGHPSVYGVFLSQPLGLQVFWQRQLTLVWIKAK